MKKQIVRFSIFQTSKVLTVFHFIFFAMYAIPMGLYFMYRGEQAAIALFFFPFVFAFIYFVVFTLVLWVYNGIASGFGGIEITLKDVD